MKPLHGKTAYLGGPIEFDASVIDWRPQVKEVLSNRFDIEVFDPFCDPKQLKSEAMRAARESEDFNTLATLASQFVSKDLIEVDRAHMIISYLPAKIPTVGTIHEIVNAVNRKIPTLIVCPQGKKNISSWLYGVLVNKHQWYLHGSWNSLYSYLEEVNDGKHTEDRRWRYVYGLI